MAQQNREITMHGNHQYVVKSQNYEAELAKRQANNESTFGLIQVNTYRDWTAYHRMKEEKEKKRKEGNHHGDTTPDAAAYMAQPQPPKNQLGGPLTCSSCGGYTNHFIIILVRLSQATLLHADIALHGLE